MSLTPFYTYIDQNRETFINRLIDYVRRPSISAYGEGMGEVADYLVKWLNEMNFNARLVPTKGWPMVLGRRSDAPDAPTVLLYGHYDVQPPDPLDKWITPPFEPTIRDGRLYARGVGDNKGQHFAQLLAVESLLKLNNTLPCNV
ncbi:MAG: M20/M25/M40 family metallo-hydrolase, partial [Chloroflexi bacterium]|nr:M20/M25/M40 family metallo-hydrolase [Chloroflexota bacterium]